MIVLIIVLFNATIFIFSYFWYKWSSSRPSPRCEEMLRLTLEKLHSGINFDPDKSILLSKKDIHDKGYIETNRIYKSHKGDYFLYIGTDIGPGYFSPLSEERAKNALRTDKTAFQKEFPDEMPYEKL